MPEKVILVTSYSYFPHLSGVAEIIKATYTGLLKNKLVDRVVLVCANTKKAPGYEMIDGIDVYRYEMKALLDGRVPLPGKQAVTLIDQLIHQYKPYQIHNHTRFQFLSLAAISQAHKNKLPLIHVEYLASHVKGEGFLVNTASYIWDQTFSRYIFSKADKIVSTSESIHDFITSELGVKKTTSIVIPNASTLHPSSVTYIDKFSHIEQFQMAYIGRFVKLKNTPIIIKAMKVLKDRGRNFMFYLAGDGSLKEEILTYIKENKLDTHITFLGKISKEEVTSTLTKTHLFLNPSCLEGLPNTVLEAVSQTNMVIVTDVGGNRDIVKQKDFLIPLPALTPEILADKIEVVMDHYSRYIQPWQEAKDWVVKTFNWGHVIESYQKEILPIRK